MSLKEVCQALTWLDHLFQHRGGENVAATHQLFALLHMELHAERMASMQQQQLGQYFILHR